MSCLQLFSFAYKNDIFLNMKVLNKIVLFLTVVSLVACGPKKQDEEPIDDEPPIDDFIDDGDDEEEMIEYNEEEDNLGDDDEDDLSLIKNAFTDVDNYSIDSHSYFNKDGLYNYYRHYSSNYVNDKTVLYTSNSEYAYPHNSDYLSILNKGYLNKNNNLYSFLLVGEDIETRLSSKVNESSLIKESENDNSKKWLLKNICPRILQYGTILSISLHLV